MAKPSSYISVLQLTDPHIMGSPDATLLGVDTSYYFEAVLELALSSDKQFDLCLLTGDIAQEACTASYQLILNALQKHNIPTICLPGNHDNFEIMQEVFSTEQVNCRKRQVLGNWQILALDSQVFNSPDGYLSADELAFLQENLTTHPNLNTLIAVHHHCLPSGCSWMDTMMIKNAQELLDLIKNHPNVKTIINGHIHQVTDVTKGSVRILSTPSTCFQFEPQSAHFSLDNTSPGYRWIDLYPDGSLQTGIERITEKLKGLRTDTQGY
jgi:Icc protein